MAFIIIDSIVLKTADFQTLQVEKDFKYLGSWINQLENNIKVRKFLARNALHNMHIIWKSKINLPLKRRLFVVTIEIVLIYESELWILNAQHQKFTEWYIHSMLRKTLNISWQEQFTNKYVYGKLP